MTTKVNQIKISYGVMIIALFLYTCSSVASGPVPIIPVIILFIGTFRLWKQNMKLLLSLVLLLIYYVSLFEITIDWIIFHQFSYVELLFGPIVHIYFVYVLFEELKLLCNEPYLVRNWQDARSFAFSFMAFYLIIKPFTALILMPSSFYIHIALIVIKIIIIVKIVGFIRNVVTDYTSQSSVFTK